MKLAALRSLIAALSNKRRTSIDLGTLEYRPEKEVVKLRCAFLSRKIGAILAIKLNESATFNSCKTLQKSVPFTGRLNPLPNFPLSNCLMFFQANVCLQSLVGF